MSTYIASKKIISKAVKLSLLLATTHLALTHLALASFEDSIDLEEQIPVVKPEDLSPDLEEIQKMAKETYAKGAQAVDDIIHVGDIKSKRDEAINLLTTEQKTLKEFQEKVHQLEEELKENNLKLNDKENKIANLKKELSTKTNKISALVKVGDDVLSEKTRLESNLKKAQAALEEQEKKLVAAYSKGDDLLSEKTRLESDLKKAQAALEEQESHVSTFENGTTTLESDLKNTQATLEKERLEAQEYQDTMLDYLEKLRTDHKVEVAQKQNEISQVKELLNNKEAQNVQLAQDLTEAQQSYQTMQAEIAVLKQNHEQEKKNLSDSHLTKLEEINNDIAEKEQLLSNQQQVIDQLQQEQYNRLEQDRDWSDIRSYFEQQEANALKNALSKESDAKIEQLNIQHQSEKGSLESQINSLQARYDTILMQTDKNLADITEDLTRRLNLAEALSQKNTQDLLSTQSELTKITQENRSKELVIVNLEKKLMENEQELAASLGVNDKSSDKIKELENDKSSLEASLNRLLREQDQNLAQIQELEEKLLSEQEKHNHYTQQIAQLNEQNQIAKESLAKQILLQGRTIPVIDNNDVQELGISNQSRDLELNAPSIVAAAVNSQTINMVQSMTSVMTNSIEAASSQLYDSISSRFNWNDHISSGEERGQVEIWIKQGAGITRQKPTEASGNGYKGRTHGLFIGIDHECELGDKNLIGAAIALNNKSKMQLLDSQARLITNSNIFSVYGKRYLDSQFAISGAASYFRATTKATNFVENIEKIKTHGVKFDLELSYNKLVGQDQSWQPFVGVSYSTISAFDVNFKDQGVVVKMKKSKLLSGKIGTRVQLKQYNLENGINISPSLMASISKPLKITSGGKFVVSNAMPNQANNSLLTHQIKDATLNLGGDLRINRNNIDVIASYNFSIRKKYQSHSGAIKLEVKL